jgi:uncharacterized membrane protein
MGMRTTPATTRYLFVTMPLKRATWILRSMLVVILVLAAAAFTAPLLTGPHYADGVQAPGYTLWVWLHLATVIPSIILGFYLLGAAKGTARHRLLGKIWCALMVITALAALMIRGYFLPNWHGLNVIHIFSVITLVSVPGIIIAARRHNVVAHQRAVFGLCTGGLFIAGLFAFMPGRILGDALYGWM